MGDHGRISDPGKYVKALAAHVEDNGGEVVTREVSGFRRDGNRIAGVQMGKDTLDCDAVVLATGAWSGPLSRELGLKVPLESERGYHLELWEPSFMPRAPVMIASGKFVATPMEMGMRCAGVVEFGGLKAGPSKAPLALLRKQVAAAYPDLEYAGEDEWLGHRPAPSDSLPLIGEVGQTGVFTAFGHHHIGLTGGPKTGRLVADLLTRRPPNIDMAPYSPNRFAI